MKPPTRLKLIRAESGLEPRALAEASGISVPEYYDLETSDDLESNIALGNLRRLAVALKIKPSTLFSSEGSDERISPAGLRSLLDEQLKSRHLKLAQFEDEVGWRLGGFIEHPEAAILQWNMTCLYDVCRALGCSWAAVLDGIQE